MQVTLCQASEVPEGTMKHFELMGYDLLAVHLSGRYFVLDGACTVRFADLAQGRLDAEKMAIVCSDCGGSWELETGQPKDPPASFPLTTYSVEPSGDELTITFTY